MHFAPTLLTLDEGVLPIEHSHGVTLDAAASAQNVDLEDVVLDEKVVGLLPNTVRKQQITEDLSANALGELLESRHVDVAG